MPETPDQQKQAYLAMLESLKVPADLDKEFLYATFLYTLEGAKNLRQENQIVGSLAINPLQLTLYLVNEHMFYLYSHPDKTQADLAKDPAYQQFLGSVSLDKYFTNEHLAFHMGSFASRFNPSISTMNLYLNFILGMLSRYKNNDPKETLIVDILNKGFQMAKCVSSLLENGFETEAFSTWRTLHENECILQVIVKYGQPVIESYLKHMKYGMAFRGALATKEETDATFIEIKEGMRQVDLKSKDMKRFIEYGWLLGVPNVMQMEGFKFNFRDGVERVAGLNNYSKVYEMSSEIAHSINKIYTGLRANLVVGDSATIKNRYALTRPYVGLILQILNELDEGLQSFKRYYRSFDFADIASSPAKPRRSPRSMPSSKPATVTS
jgi:hypothetical protein